MDVKMVRKYLGARRLPDRFADGQLRTLQRKVSIGGQRKGRLRRCTSFRSIGLANCANPTSPI